MSRFDLPPDLAPDEERAVIAALEAYLGEVPRPSRWTLAGRIDGLRLGTLQVRQRTDRPWNGVARVAFARRGTDGRSGRGDSR